MPHESSQAELARLLKEQAKTRQDEVFGGLSPVERAEYNRKVKRINELEAELTASADVRKSYPAKAEQKHQWSKTSATDTPQAAAKQPYRSREKGSINANTEASGSNRLRRRNEPQGKDDQ